MADKGSFSSIFFTAGAGALATVAGIYVAKKLRKFFGKKPKMRLFNNNLLLSTRSTWLISELGAEEDFELTDDHNLPLYPDDDKPTDFPMLQDAGHNWDKRRSAANMQLAHYNSESSLNTVDEDEELSEYEYDTESVSSNVPATVVNNDFTMIEGAAICLYLADMYGQFLPEPDRKAEYYSWVVYSAATFDSIIKTLQQQLVDTPEHRRNPVVVESALKGFHAFARALSDTLESREYLCGESFTAADCVLGFTLWWAYTIDHGDLLKDYPVLMDYLGRLRQRPAFQSTFGSGEDWDWSRYFTAYIRGIKPKT